MLSDLLQVIRTHEREGGGGAALIAQLPRIPIASKMSAGMTLHYQGAAAPSLTLRKMNHVLRQDLFLIRLCLELI